MQYFPRFEKRKLKYLYKNINNVGKMSYRGKIHYGRDHKTKYNNSG